MSSLFPEKSHRSIRMKKTLLTIVLVFAGIEVNQLRAQTQAQPAAPQQPAAQQPAQPGQQAASPQQKKEIKDPAEYNAYVGAVQQSDPAAKVSGLEAFLQQYPNSVMKEDALELLMVAYQQRSEEHTSELQSPDHLVCRLLLEKKKR